jgi:hypothetical protein
MEYRHSGRTAAERAGIAIHPFKQKQLVEQTEVCCVALGAGMKEA